MKYSSASPQYPEIPAKVAHRTPPDPARRSPTQDPAAETGPPHAMPVRRFAARRIAAGASPPGTGDRLQPVDGGDRRPQPMALLSASDLSASFPKAFPALVSKAREVGTFRPAVFPSVPARLKNCPPESKQPAQGNEKAPIPQGDGRFGQTTANSGREKATRSGRRRSGRSWCCRRRRRRRSSRPWRAPASPSARTRR